MREQSWRARRRRDDYHFFSEVKQMNSVSEEEVRWRKYEAWRKGKLWFGYNI